MYYRIYKTDYLEIFIAIFGIFHRPCTAGIFHKGAQRCEGILTGSPETCHYENTCIVVVYKCMQKKLEFFTKFDL